MDLELPGKDEGGTEDQETFVVDEVLFVHQHKCGGSDQSDCGRTQTRKGGNDIFVVLELGKKVGDDQYQYERRQTYGKCGQTGTEDSHKSVSYTHLSDGVKLEDEVTYDFQPKSIATFSGKYAAKLPETDVLNPCLLYTSRCV